MMSAGIYDLDFVFRRCGFDWVPPEIQRDLLLNVALDPVTRDIKLYVLDASHGFVHKISQNQIGRQYRAETAGIDPRVLCEFIGCELDLNHILIDSVEDDVLYVNIDAASRAHYVDFLEALCARLAIPAEKFLETVTAVCGAEVFSFMDCFRRRAIALLRVPTRAGTSKIYARPFAIGNELKLSGEVIEFLCNVHGCDTHELPGFLDHFWAARDLTTGRMVIGTQHDALLGRPGLPTSA